MKISSVIIGFILCASLAVNFLFIYNTRKYTLKIETDWGRYGITQINVFEIYSLSGPRYLTQDTVPYMNADFNIRLDSTQSYSLTWQSMFK